MHTTSLAHPVISVITPTFDRRDSLRVTLEGLARQTYPTNLWEAVVVSDGATDGTDEFLRETRSQWPFSLRPIFQQNGGPARARNRGAQEAQGRVLVFLDDDVEPSPDFLIRHAAHHERDEPLGVIGPLLADPQRRTHEPVWIAWEHATMREQYDNFQNGTWGGAGPNHFYSGNASVRRADMLAVNGFDETFKRQEDVEMAARLQRDRNVAFRFDYDARGTHRPTRTRASWLKIPHAYGQLDVERVRRGDATTRLLWHAYHSRNLLTRRLADVSLRCPPLSPALRALGFAVSGALYRARRDRAAIAVLSSVYNVRYLEGMRLEMGEGALRKLLSASDAPASLEAMTS